MKAILLIFCMMISLSAQAMRCGTQLIEVGALAPVVQQRCGEPLSKNRYESSGWAYDQFGYRIPAGVQVIEEWVYQQSPNAFMYILTFRDGRLEKIDTTRNP